MYEVDPARPDCDPEVTTLLPWQFNTFADCTPGTCAPLPGSDAAVADVAVPDAPPGNDAASTPLDAAEAAAVADATDEGG